MGYDATNILEERTNLDDVDEFLRLLGFKRIGPVKLGDIKAVEYWHYDEHDYERFQELEIWSIVVDEGICQAAISWYLTPSMN